jgi:predicted transcriptional regulator
MENLDQIITMVKTQSNDPHLNCTPNIDLKDYMEVEVVLVEKNYELIEKINILKKSILIGIR